VITIIKMISPLLLITCCIFDHLGVGLNTLQPCVDATVCFIDVVFVMAPRVQNL